MINKQIKGSNQRKINKKISSVMPMSFQSDRNIIKAVNPVYRDSLSTLLSKYKNTRINYRYVKVNNTGYRKIDFEKRSFFIHIKENEYKCLICNSYVKKIGVSYRNLDNKIHRKHLKKGEIVCNIMKTESIKVDRVRRKVKYIPTDDTFMTIIE